MADYKPLTDKEIRDTAGAHYAERQAKSLPQEQPAIVLVGGQPGAGKSAASSMVKAEQAIQGRRNIVEEGTFRSPDGAGKFVQGLQERGYKVELFAMATSREESLL